MSNPVIPSAEILEWQELELGVLIHYCMEIYDPDFKAYKTSEVRTRLSPDKINPDNLSPEQWVRSAHALGAKYAVLVANHCTGFSLWQTKENDYCPRSLKWKDGKGDICAEFISACRKYGIRPGFYYSTGCNGYYDINDDVKQDYFSPKYRDYVRHVENQVKELWSEYGELFEIWFDGGIIPPEDGGPDIFPILKKYQPNAVCFQGPKDHPFNIRWVGNENGLAPENCWSASDMGESRFDGTVADKSAGEGDPDGKYFSPAETDMPNRDNSSFGGGWAWKAGEDDKVLPPEYLLDCYVNSVGRNTNLLLGMAISRDGDFKDEEQFISFGKLLKQRFSTPVISIIPDSLSAEITAPEGKMPEYLVIREDQTNGQLIRGFTVETDGKTIYSGESIGHKRILRLSDFNAENAKTFRFTVTKFIHGAKLRDIALY